MVQIFQAIGKSLWAVVIGLLYPPRYTWTVKCKVSCEYPDGEPTKYEHFPEPVQFATRGECIAKIKGIFWKEFQGSKDTVKPIKHMTVEVDAWYADGAPHIVTTLRF